jgi:hypothetical protein
MHAMTRYEIRKEGTVTWLVVAIHDNGFIRVVERFASSARALEKLDRLTARTDVVGGPAPWPGRLGGSMHVR